MKKLKICDTIIEALEIDVEKHRLIAVTGAGGKTTCIYELAKELREMGIPAAITTTTHMEENGKYGFVPAGEAEGNGKIRGNGTDFPKALLKKYKVVLVEADGSRRLPFKVPAEHEPVLPEGVDLVIGVAGASALGKSFEESCLRYEIACKHPGFQAGDTIKVRHLLEALSSDWGQKKGVACDYRYLIGQAELLSRSQTEEILMEADHVTEQGCLMSFYRHQYWRITEYAGK